MSDPPSVPPTEAADDAATGPGPGSAPAASTGPASTGPVSTGPVSTGPVSTGPVSTGPVSTGPAGGGTDAAAVAAYFRQIDAVAVEKKASQDPQTLARNVLDQAMSGNMGAIDGLIATQRALEARLGQILPPPSCREHHQRSVRLFGRAIALLERTRDAMSGQGDIGGLAAEGRAIEVEARAVDALANDLRRAAGLAPVP